MYYSWIGLGLILPTLFAAISYGTLRGAFSGLLWGGPVRMFIFGQLILSVNSICHTFGNRNYGTSDYSRNNWLVALPTLGEGWHNNHHAFPNSAWLGLKWWQLDIGGAFIELLKFLRIAWDVKGISKTFEIIAHRLWGPDRNQK